VFKQTLYLLRLEKNLVDGIMDTEKRVLVDPDRAVRCGWCGSYESDKWRHDMIRSSVWCSRSCYWAGHLEEFVCLTMALLVIDFSLVSIQLTSTLPQTLNTFLMFIFLFLLTGFMVLGSMVAYSSRQDKPRHES